MSDDTTHDELMTRMHEWVARVESALGLDAGADGQGDGHLDIDEVLGIAGVAARAAVRPAAPVTTYLIGYATGRAEAAGASPEEAFSDAVERVRALAVEQRSDGAQ